MMTLRHRRRLWPTIIIAALGGHVILGVTLMRVAAADPHFAVEPDYYRRAVGWDTTQAQARRSRESGWRVVPSLGAFTGEPLQLTLTVTDSLGQGIDSATVRVGIRSVAHAGPQTAVALAPAAGTGHYAAHVPVTHIGLWDLFVEVDRGAQRVTNRLRVTIHPDRPATLSMQVPGGADPARVAAGMRRE